MNREEKHCDVVKI
ncbi:hypothetical protein LAY20_05230 [Escherichia coli]|nr:hypothetical protein [Escherichia coli]